MNSPQTSLSYNDVQSLVSQTSLTSTPTSVTSSLLSRQSSTQTFYYGVPSSNNNNNSMDLLEEDDELFVNPTEEVFMTMNTHKTYWETLSEFTR